MHINMPRNALALCATCRSVKRFTPHADVVKERAAQQYTNRMLSRLRRRLIRQYRARLINKISSNWSAISWDSGTTARPPVTVSPLTPPIVRYGGHATGSPPSRQVESIFSIAVPPSCRQRGGGEAQAVRRLHVTPSLLMPYRAIAL